MGVRGSAVDGGVRALGVLRPLGFGLGIDYSIAGNDPDLILSFMRSFWRGGLFGLGGMFRVNYLPTRDHTVTHRLPDPPRRLLDGSHPPQDRSREAVRARGELREPAAGGGRGPGGRPRPGEARGRVAGALRRAVPRSARRHTGGGHRPPAREDPLLPGAHGQQGRRLSDGTRLSRGDSRLPRGARPRVLARRERRRRGADARREQRGGTPDLGPGARDPARRGDPPLQPRARAHQGSRHHARLRGPGARGAARSG